MQRHRIHTVTQLPVLLTCSDNPDLNHPEHDKGVGWVWTLMSAFLEPRESCALTSHKVDVGYGFSVMLANDSDVFNKKNHDPETWAALIGLILLQTAPEREDAILTRDGLALFLEGAGFGDPKDEAQFLLRERGKGSFMDEVESLLNAQIAKAKLVHWECWGARKSGSYWHQAVHWRDRSRTSLGILVPDLRTAAIVKLLLGSSPVRVCPRCHKVFMATSDIRQFYCSDAHREAHRMARFREKQRARKAATK